MKKLSLTLLLFILTFSLAACGRASRSDYNELVNERDALLKQITALESERDGYRDQVDGLFAELSESLGRDVNALVSFVVLEETPRTVMVPFHTDGDETAFDLLKEAFGTELEYNTDWGAPFVTGLGTLSAQYGNFIEILKNGEALEVGIADAPFGHADVFTFQVTWWDTSAKAVYELLNAFEDTHLDAALETPNFYLFQAYALRTNGPDLTRTYRPTAADTAAGLVSQIMIARAVGASETTYANALIQLLPSLEISDQYLFLNSLVFMAVEPYRVTAVFNFLDAFVAYTDALTFDEVDSFDAVAMMVLALDHELYLVEATDYLETAVFEQDNSASIALGLAALAVAGRNPFNLVQDDQSLVELLLTFHLGEGRFKWRADDTTADMMFSTPQSLLALIVLENKVNNQLAQPFARP